jgi:hypothetical protein
MRCLCMRLLERKGSGLYEQVSRNHISHEYPEHPELTAKYLNKIFSLSPQLLLILSKIKKALGESSLT